MRRARFRVVGRLDMASALVEGTVIIDRGAGLFGVRRLRSRKVYELPLSTVATMVVQRVLLAERKEKKAQRRGFKLRAVSP